ncbi:UDP-sugar pyrophosphorylase [Vitis vinifera]|uniref:UDP-sugar pyrophosphorylase n=1 Tax=Vitis vinifera TaxID=29760 RepID=A0A438K3M1_VITVI|nr:UDP-sugar pyrophosphorylase [Vitis vinifera]
MVYFQFQIERNANSISNLSALASLLSGSGFRRRQDRMASVVGSTTEKLSKLDINGESIFSVPNLRKNLSILSPDQIKLARMLVEAGQSHLFQSWAEPGVEDEEKRGFFEQVARLNASYPGGLTSYIKTARELLADSKAGKNPFDGFTPSVSEGISMFRKL